MEWTNYLRAAPPRIAEIYLWILGTSLLLEGLSLFALGAVPINLLPPLLAQFRPDPPHDALHVVWGLTILGLPIVRPRTFPPEIMATVFGVFYVGLAFLGILVYHPLGLRLDLAQNVFHFTVGPIALVLGLWSWWWVHHQDHARFAGQPD